MELSFCYFTFC